MSQNNQQPSSALWSSFDTIRRMIDYLTLGLNMLGTVLIILLVVLINSDVVGRAFFGAPVSGVPEMVSLSIVAIVFLQIAQTVVVGRLTRSDALLNVVARKWPRVRQAMEVVFNLLAAGLLIILFSSSVSLFEKSWRKQTFIGSIGDFTAPVWPVKLLILVGCAALVLQFTLSAIKALMPQNLHHQPVSHDDI
jgi:TRAP-type C4-dicarboxylate transport system permease small subunit